jgi:thymidylate kinase
MLITFSGLDGAGKSTLIESLKESLEKRNQRVVVSHMYYDLGVYACAQSVLKRVARRANGRANTPARTTHAPRELPAQGRLRVLAARIRYRIVWNKALRYCLYPVDVLIFLCYRFYIEKFRKQILIMDRYFYDTLADVTEGRKGYGIGLLRLLTPTPSVPIYLDISPEEAHARKSEYSVDRLRRRRLSYLKLLPYVPSLVVVSASPPVESTRHALEMIVLERMSAS